MAEVLYTGLVPLERLEQIARVCHFAPEAIFLAEMLPTHLVETPREREALLRFTFFNQKLHCTDYTSGRIFQRDRELRWERQDTKVRVVYLGEAESEAEFVGYQLQKKDILGTYPKKSEPTYYYLFGERLRDKDVQKLGKAAEQGDFAVVRIPRTLRYPVSVNNHRYARLVVCEYQEEVTGRVLFLRFQGLETLGKVKKPEEAR